MKLIQTISLGAAVIMAASCAVIRPGEVGVKRKFGKLSERVYDEGTYALNPFGTVMIKTPIRTVNMEVDLSLPSKEGLNILANISILYKIDKAKVPTLIQDVGNDYESIISAVFRSAAADVCAQYMAKDMHSGKRAEIEDGIVRIMDERLNQRGIDIEAVLLKSISLPPGLYNSIQSRLEAEQEVLRMKYLLEQEKLEADRKVIEAKGTKDAQLILSEGLTAEILQLRSIEAFLKLAESENSKVIITDGKSPLLIQEEEAVLD
jgi:regulator of protease activity HflC (stomatin/prohibitin superfamily)